MTASSASNKQQARVTYKTEPEGTRLNGPLTVEVTEGDATAIVENDMEVVVKPGSIGSVSRIKVTGKPDLDGSGDPDLTDEIIHTTTEQEATGLVGTVAVEPLP